MIGTLSVAHYLVNATYQKL